MNNILARNKVCLEKGFVPSYNKILSGIISLYIPNKGHIQNSMVLLLLWSLVIKINGRKNTKNNTKVVKHFFLLQLFVLGRPISLLLIMLIKWIFTNTNDTFSRGVSINSSVPQGTKLFKLSSHISPTNVATLIKINKYFIFSWSRYYYSCQSLVVLQETWQNYWWHQKQPLSWC